MSTAARRWLAAIVVLPVAATVIGATVLATAGNATITNVTYSNSPFNNGPVTITFTNNSTPQSPKPIPAGSYVKYHRSGTSGATSDDFYSQVQSNASSTQNKPVTTVMLDDPEQQENDPGCPNACTGQFPGNGRVDPGAYDVTFYQGDPRKDPAPPLPPTSVVLDSCSQCVAVSAPGAPTMTSISQQRIAAGATKVSAVIKGTNLARGTTVQVQPITGNTAQDVSVALDSPAAYQAGDELDVLITVPAAATGGVRNILLTNTDGQTFTCVGCFTVLGPNLTSVSPTRATNNDSDSARQITFTGPAGTISKDALPSLEFVGNPGVNTKESLTIPANTGSATVNPDGSSITALYNLVAAAPGDNAYVPSISSASTGTFNICSCKFSIDQPNAPTVTSVSPAAQDRGTSQVVTVGGTNFAKGTNVTVVGGGVTTTKVDFVSRTQLKATFSVDAGAAAGKRDVQIDLSDVGTQTNHTATCTACYTINGNTPPPTPTSTATSTASPTGSPCTTATGSASPTATRTGTPSPSSTATASPTATSSATATATTSASSTASSSASSTASSTASSGGSCVPLTVAVSPRDVVPTQQAFVSAHGSPNQFVELYAYSRPSTTYGLVRSGKLNASGNISWTVTPGGNTRLYVHYSSGGTTTASTDSGTSVITVHTSLSLSAYRDGVRKYHFQGTNLPRRAGQLITLYRYASGPNHDKYCIPTAESDTFTKDDAGCTAVIASQAKTGPNNTWRIDRTFTGDGKFYFVVRTSTNINNGRGHSNQRLTIIH